MVSWVLCAGLVLLHISCLVEAELHHAVIFPSELRSQHSETICIHLEGAQGDTRVQISLHLEKKNTTVVEKIFQSDSISNCVPIQVPTPEQMEEVGTLSISMENAGQGIMKSSKVLVKKTRSNLLVQSDKAVYKPGQTVKFRILSINEDFQPRDIVLPVVELQDPGKNRIGQWLNVSLSQGMAELSLPLSSEPTLGEYSIRVKDEVHTISVEEYVLPKFEVTLQFPKVVMFDSEKFPLRVCGRYTYGKPVQGNYTATVCQKLFVYWWRPLGNTNTDICSTFSGKLDRLGCDTIEVTSKVFKLRNTDMERALKGEVFITEDGTGIELSTVSQAPISNLIHEVSFVDAESNYKSGIPFNGVVKVVDASDNPIPGIKVYLTSFNLINETLVTDDNGQATFSVNTSEWRGQIFLSATTNLHTQPYVHGVISPDYVEAYLNLKPFYSRNKSFLKLHSLDKVLPCEGHQEVQVEYIIQHKELKNNVDHFDLHYLVTFKGSIHNYGSLEISIENKTEDLHGKTTLKIPLNAGTSSTFQALAYTILPNGDILADSAKYKIQKCFHNKVTVGFSPDEVLPGSDVSLQVQAAPGSLCGLRVVDQSVVLMKPEKELSADKVYNLFPLRNDGRYDYRIKEYGGHCPNYPFHFPPPMGPSNQPVMPHWHRPFLDDQDADVYSLFEGVQLKMLTDAEIRKPMKCSESYGGVGLAGPQGPGGPIVEDLVYDELDSEMSMPRGGTVGNKETEKVRTYFPETWLWELIAVGDSGNADLNQKAPDTITEWNAGAVCLGQSGFGMSSPTSLRVFQPFFVDLTLPYSVVRGETFILKASVFNYLKQCIKIKVNLRPTEELEQRPCIDCAYSSCLCADESKTFYWNLKATKLGEVNITVRAKAVKTKELCQNEIPFVPKQGATDTIVKPLFVQPGGVLVEKSHSSLLCINEGEDNNKTEEVSLQFPKNILKDSERAYVTVLGDIMGTALQNLDRLLAMPYGCGEQNMVLFAPNIFILQYLEKTHQLTDEIKSKAINFLKSGYQRQLTYKRDDGSYSAFGKSDPEGNTWLSAFVIKSFSKGRPYIFIDESHLEKTFTWLQNIRKKNGCFRNVGRLLNTAMQGGVKDDVSLSAYVTMALIEAGVSLEHPLVRDAVSCLRKAAAGVSNIYTLALLTYTFTLCKETNLRAAVLNKLEEKAVRKDGQLHWERDSAPPIQDSYWYRAPSTEVEMNAYVLLALLSGPKPDLGKSTEIVNWLSKQQNPYGGFSSTQDTVVALQALAKYSELTFSDQSDVTLTVSASSGFLEKFHVDKNNRLLLQRASLPAVTGDYTLSTTGDGCVFVQAVLRYNVPPPKRDTSFSLQVTPHSNRECLGDTVTNFEIHINVTYTGTRKRTNMVLIEVKMLSGYIPIKSTVRKLQDRLIQRSEIQTDMVTLYLNEVGQNPIHISFMVEQDIEVKGLKPAIVKVYDYYETDEQAVAEYNHPCNTGDSSNSR